MAFGLLMRDNAPVDFPFRRGAAPQAAVRLGSPFPLRRVAMGRPLPVRRGALHGYGWVSAEGGGDDGTEMDGTPMPGAAPTQGGEASGTSIAAGLMNLGTSLVNAITGAIQPHSGAAGTYCPSGYYYSNGRCVPASAGGGSSGTGTLLLVGGGLALAAILLSRRRGQ